MSKIIKNITIFPLKFSIFTVYLCISYGQVFVVFLLQGLSYDLGDCTKWEYMFPNTDKPLLQIPEAEEDIMEGLEDDEVYINLYEPSHEKNKFGFPTRSDTNLSQTCTDTEAG